MSTKDSRLSFRLETKIGIKIDKLVETEINIRDRSDFGNQAIRHFIDILEKKESSLLLIINAIQKLAEETKNDDIKEIKILNVQKKKLIELLTFDVHK